MPDNRQDIYDHSYHAQNGLAAARAAASLFDVPKAKTAMAAVQADVDAINADLLTLLQDNTGALQLVPFPSEFQMHQGQPFSYQFAAIGGAPPYRFYRLSGTIALGLTLTEGGLLSGTPQAFPPGFTFTLNVQDANPPLANPVLADVWEHILS